MKSEEYQKKAEIIKQGLDILVKSKNEAQQ